MRRGTEQLKPSSTRTEALSVSYALSEEEQALLQCKLWHFLGKRTERYTMGYSSSVTVETAQELLTSICFTLNVYCKATHCAPQLLLQKPLEQLFANGLNILESKQRETKALWQAARKSAPNIQNISYHETLQNIGGFFKHYDYRFFAHQIPCDIDYQLCHAIPQSLLGIEYINAYLRRLLVENSILQLFDQNCVIRLLENYCVDYKGLLINLCEPIIVNALGLALLGKNPLFLRIYNDDCTALSTLFSSLNNEQANRKLTVAALYFCKEAGITNPFSQNYITDTATTLWPRIRTALPHTNLQEIFIPFA